MSLDLDRSAWRRVKFGDVVRQCKESTDPEIDGVERYVAGEHMETDNLRISSWGEVGDGYLGPAFHRKFKAGQVLYGSRRTYLRKVARADFDGVCANTTFVMESADQSILLPDLLPFLMSTESFHAHSISESKGSVNPYVNWPDIAKFEFDLPPLDQQRRIADLMWAAETHKRAVQSTAQSMSSARSAYVDRILSSFSESGQVADLNDLVAPGRPITYGILKPGPFVSEGVPVVKVRDFPDGEINTDDLLRTAPEIDDAYARSRLREGDLLISIRGTVGRLAEVPCTLDGANITQDTARLSIGGAHSVKYVRLALESKSIQAKIKRAMTGLAVKGINIGELRKIPIPVPPSAADEDRLVSMASSLWRAEAKVHEELVHLDAIQAAVLFELQRGLA